MVEELEVLFQAIYQDHHLTKSPIPQMFVQILVETVDQIIKVIQSQKESTQIQITYLGIFPFLFHRVIYQLVLKKI